MSDERKTAITADSGFGTTHPLPEGSRLVVPESAALAALRAQLDGATQQMSLASESARKMEAAWREECKETDALRAREATLAAEVERYRKAHEKMAEALTDGLYGPQRRIENALRVWQALRPANEVKHG